MHFKTKKQKTFSFFKIKEFKKNCKNTYRGIINLGAELSEDPIAEIIINRDIKNVSPQTSLHKAENTTKTLQNYII